MTYCNLDTEEIRRFQEVYTRAELKKWFEELVSEYGKMGKIPDGMESQEKCFNQNSGIPIRI